MNLLDNVIRYTEPSGHVRVSLEATPLEACLTVQDTGIGIAPEHLPYLFECFYRADLSHTQAGEWNRIGTRDCRMDGPKTRRLVMVRSQVGFGSCFTVILPLTPWHRSPSSRTIDVREASYSREASLRCCGFIKQGE